MVRTNLDMFLFAKTLIQADQNVALQINSVSNAKKIIKDLKQHFEKDEC